MNRFVLKSDHPSVRAVILPPAFEGCPFCCYVLGPPVSGRQLYGKNCVNQQIAQRITATMPLWTQVRALVQASVTPFLVRGEGGYESVLPQFRMPIENPVSDVGAGWHIVSDEPGREFAVRRCPLMLHGAVPLEHPYFYALAGRPSPDRALWTVPVATPYQRDYVFPEVDLWAYVSDLDRSERQNAEGFVLPQN